MLRILRTFAWMRWRILVNTLEKTGSRDATQRLSLALERLAPIILLVLAIPTALVLAGLAGFAGFQLAVGSDRSIAFQIVRALLLIGTVLAIIGPITLPMMDRTNPVRLLLLPISTRTLYVAHAAGALTDPWISLQLPVVLALPIGLGAGGAIGAGVLCVAAGLLFALTLIGISAFTTTVIHLLLRDRRRGELIALVLILILPLIGTVPSVVRTIDRRGDIPPWVAAVPSRVLAVTPSELYAKAVGAAVRDRGNIGGTVATLAAMGFAVHVVGLLLFRRVLSSPATTGSRRVSSMRGVWGRALPGVSPGTSAVALALLKLALRTPRGRSILLAPFVMIVFVGLMALRSDAFGAHPFRGAGGFAPAALVAFISLIATLPISVNQFAVDRAGLTLTLLSPLTTQQLLAGKAIGIALIAMPPALVSMGIAAVTFPGGQLAMWLALALSLVATYVLASPAAAILSALFPRAVDMNSIGRGSNAHAAAGFLGMLVFAAAAVPCAVLLVTAMQLLARPQLAPVLVLVWCVAAFGVARALFMVAERIFEQRRESLAMLM